jgi:flagellar biosynthesis regulator FlaF
MSASDDTAMTLPEQEALSLVSAAMMIDEARSRGRDPAEMAAALNNNLEMWVAIRTLAERPDTHLEEGVRANLLKLSDFVAHSVLRHGTSISDQTLDTLININMQLSEGLLEGQAKVPAAG